MTNRKKLALFLRPTLIAVAAFAVFAAAGEFLSLQVGAAAVATDSGGIQEETTVLGTPCFTLRDNTERPVTVRAGTNTVLGLDPRRIAEIPGLLENASGRPSDPPPMWDGRAAGRVADVLADW